MAMSNKYISSQQKYKVYKVKQIQHVLDFSMAQKQETQGKTNLTNAILFYNTNKRIVR